MIVFSDKHYIKKILSGTIILYTSLNINVFFKNRKILKKITFLPKYRKRQVVFGFFSFKHF